MRSLNHSILYTICVVYILYNNVFTLLFDNNDQNTIIMYINGSELSSQGISDDILSSEYDDDISYTTRTNNIQSEDNTRSNTLNFFGYNNKKKNLIFGSAIVTFLMGLSYLLYAGAKRLFGKEEKSPDLLFKEFEQEAVQWYLSEEVFQTENYETQVKKDFQVLKGREKYFIFTNINDTKDLSPQDEKRVQLYRQSVWDAYKHRLRPLFLYNRFETGRVIFLFLEMGLFNVLGYKGESFFKYDPSNTKAPLYGDDAGFRNKIVKANSKELGEKVVKSLNHLSFTVKQFIKYYNRMYNINEDYYADIKERITLAKKPNYEIIAELNKK